MEQSEDIKELATALNEFQAELVTVGKTAANPFFKSKYAPLDEIMLKAQPVLTKHGLSVTQPPSYLGAQPALTTILMHTSGQWQRSTMPLLVAKEDPQAHGSAITYARRYSYAAVLGIVIDEDDDGNSGSQQPARRQATAPSKPVVELATSVQKVQVAAFYRAMGLSDEEMVKALKENYGIDSQHPMTKQIANKIIEDLK